MKRSAQPTQPVLKPARKLAETQAQKRTRLNQEARALRRIRITCMNPNKKAMTSEIFTISNSMVGTVKRCVPFDTEDGWHVEDMILKISKPGSSSSSTTLDFPTARRSVEGNW